MQAVLITYVLQKCSLIQMLKVDIKFAVYIAYSAKTSMIRDPSTVRPFMQLSHVFSG